MNQNNQNCAYGGRIGQRRINRSESSSNTSGQGRLRNNNRSRGHQNEDPTLGGFVVSEEDESGESSNSVTASTKGAKMFPLYVLKNVI